jgi:fructose-bisphosphate aldolase, class I
MSSQELIDAARTLVADDKGLVVMYESNPTCNKRFARFGIPQTEEARCSCLGTGCFYSSCC